MSAEHPKYCPVCNANTLHVTYLHGKKKYSECLKCGRLAWEPLDKKEE